MWAQGGTYAEPLMSDEQPGSWMFYEGDLRTDRLSANKQRSVAWAYRQQEFCPAEVLPGFAFHQTDRDVPERQKSVCPDGRCSNFSRTRDFDLLGYRYSLLSRRLHIGYLSVTSRDFDLLGYRYSLLSRRHGSATVGATVIVTVGLR